eukprot:COSAG02_NODE_187_length_30377_cov_3.636271_2_plen_1415_part_00
MCIGDQVLLVGSHADEVEGGESVARSRCQAMAEAVHAELEGCRAAQEQELAELPSSQGRSEAAADRARKLERALSKPLRLSPGAVAVSAKTGQGFGELREMVLNAAFDKEAFPTFGTKQPGTYRAIYRKLERSHRDESSLTWEVMQESAARQSELESSHLAVRFVGSKLSTEPDLPDADGDQAVSEPEPEYEQDTEAATQLSIVGTLQCEGEGRSPKFEDTRAQLSRAGMLRVGTRPPADLTKSGTKIGPPKKLRSGRPFCVQIDCVDPTCRFVLDAGSAKQQQRWLKELRAIAPPDAAQSNVYRDYTFAVVSDDEELKLFTVDHRGAKAVHKQLQDAGVVGGLSFPGSVFDAAKDFTHTEANWRQRAEDMERYYTELLRKQEAISHPDFKASFGFDFAWLAERHGRVSAKVRKDHELLRRAMTFLGSTGEVLCPRAQVGSTLAQRVFLRPQWLVDVMREFVRHDLEEQLERFCAEQRQRGAAAVSSADEIDSLGRQFLRRGLLHRELLPWLWRDLRPSVVDDEEQMDFLVELMVDLGLLTKVPASRPQQWLLPMRLPEKADACSHRHPSLTELTDTLSEASEVNFYGIRCDFSQALPAGLLPIVFSRCAQLCGAETSFFRHDMETINPSSSHQEGDGDAAARVSIGSAAQVHVSIGLENASCVAIVAHCSAGDHEVLCRETVELFQAQLDGVIADQWPGCSMFVTEVSPTERGWGTGVTDESAASLGMWQDMLSGEEPTAALRAQSSRTSVGTRSSMWSVQAVHGDTVLQVPEDIGVELDGKVGRVLEQPLDGTGGGRTGVPVQWQDGTKSILKPLDLERDSADLQELAQNLAPQVLTSVVSTFTRALPHGLKFIPSAGLDQPSLTFGLSRVYTDASDLMVLYQPTDGAEWELLRPTIVLSGDGKCASFQIQSFSNYALGDRRTAYPWPRRPLVAEMDPADILGDLDDLVQLAADSPRDASQRPSVAEMDPADILLDDLDDLVQLAADSPRDAYFTAFAPPVSRADGTPFLIAITAFALEYSAAVDKDAAEHGKVAMSAEQRPLPLAPGTEVTVRLELPAAAFHCDGSGTEVFVWDGRYNSAVFAVTCVKEAEARRHVCKAMISAAEHQRMVLWFELVVAKTVVSPAASVVSSPSAEMSSSTTLLPEVADSRPHIFISYRRTHFELADRVRRQLQTYGYRCFFDLDPQSGLGAGDFQAQLESSLRGVPYLLAIITPAPSGEDEVRQRLSFTECIRHYAEQGKTDYCHVELARALSDARTEVIPLFHPEYRSSDYGEQLRDLPGDIASLAAKNAKPIGDAALFDKSLEIVHELIQRHTAAKLRGRFSQELERQLSIERSLPEGVPVCSRTDELQAGEDFATLLEDLGIAQYASKLSGENIHTAAVLRELTDSDLKELGFKMGDRKLVLKWSGSE